MKPPARLDIVVPMAGRGSRFARAGFTLPKPLIDVEGRPMIAHVIDNLRPRAAHRFIFLVLAEHLREYDLEAKLRAWAGPQTLCVPVEAVTEGAACTVLLAREALSAENDLLIANSDQILDVDANEYLNFSRGQDFDGSIMVFEALDDKWSFAKVNSAGDVTEVAEKRPISDLATVGVYYFRRGLDFVTGAERMLSLQKRVNGEFYVCPVYNELIAAGQRIVTWKIARSAMHGVGTPEDLRIYLGRDK